MAGDAVFDHQGGDRSLRILVEQHVMADAEAHDDVHVHLLCIQNFGLGDRVACRLESARPDLVVLREVQLKLVDAAGLAAGGEGRQAL